jgi:hypothetical protein
MPRNKTTTAKAVDVERLVRRAHQLEREMKKCKSITRRERLMDEYRIIGRSL